MDENNQNEENNIIENPTDNIQDNVTDENIAPSEGIANNSDEKSPHEKELEAVYDIPVQISAVLGRATMPVNSILKLGRGAVVELDRRVGEAIDIYVNNLLVARGEVVIVDDRLGVTMTEIIKSNR